MTSATMPADRCEPPPGTAPGTVHVLSAEGNTTEFCDRIKFRARWDGELWHMKGSAGISPRKAALCGFLYVRQITCPPPCDNGKLWHNIDTHDLRLPRYATWCPCCMGTGEASGG